MKYTLSFLEDTFKRVLKSRALDNPPDLEEKIDRFWVDIFNFYKTQPHHNLELIGRSLGMFSKDIASIVSDWDILIMSAILQWYGPQNKSSEFIRYKLTKVYNFPDWFARTIHDLIQMRFSLEIPKFSPALMMHDYNMMRLAAPHDQFMKDQDEVVKSRVTIETEKQFTERQSRIFNFLLTRERIFAYSRHEDQYGFQARQNLRGYLFKVKLKSDSDN